MVLPWKPLCGEIKTSCLANLSDRVLQESMTLSPSAALSILIPINLEHTESAPGSPGSLSSVDIQSDDENDREVASNRQSTYFPTTPTGAAAVVRPQFSCPDFAMGTARSMMGRIKDAPPVPPVPSVHFEKTRSDTENTSPTGHRVRKMNSFKQLNTVKRGWEESFGEEKVVSRKRHGLFLGRLQTYSSRLHLIQAQFTTTQSTSAVAISHLF
jgi:hypothetical protein